jgi:hypothetical protein
VCFRYPATQFVYPSAASHYLTTGGVLAAIPSPLSPSSATTASAAATQYIDYATYPSQFAATTGFEAYSPYVTTATSQFGVPAAYTTYAQLPGQLAATATGHFAAYQSQQIGDRLQ